MAFDLIKFNQQTYTVATEALAQQVEKFNEQSNGVIQLIAKPFKGDFDISSAFSGMKNIVRHRDVENGSNPITTSRLSQHENVAVKIACGTPEIAWSQAEYAWTMQNPKLAPVKIGEMLSNGMMAHMLNTAIKAGVSALSGNSEVIETSSSALDFATMTKGSSRFGDHSSSIVGWVMHSGALTQLQLKALANNERLFTYENINVLRDQFGRIFVITDSEDLKKSDGGYNTLGLSESGIVINNQDDFNSVITNATGKENISYTYQAEWSHAVSVKGYKWNISAGGSNPNAGALATPTNWIKTATSSKYTAGVLLQTAA
ncbi:major capsid protein [Moraxella sp. ZY210820]|uniref:major capsid protein n=1 Tax=Moraxella sp. ZY210820 TaxID=2904123 RepID=UPI0027305AF9|nr:major capsid protein [Moraxella sp. ZY210820]WLF84832.1 major capsid protein [Moraxella sp. ZY210820]